MDNDTTPRTIKFYGTNAAGEVMEADIPAGCAVIGVNQTHDGTRAAAPIEWVDYQSQTLKRRGEEPAAFPPHWMRYSQIQWRPYSAIGGAAW